MSLCKFYKHKIIKKHCFDYCSKHNKHCILKDENIKCNDFEDILKKKE